MGNASNFDQQFTVSFNHSLQVLNFSANRSLKERGGSQLSVPSEIFKIRSVSGKRGAFLETSVLVKVSEYVH